MLEAEKLRGLWSLLSLESMKQNYVVSSLNQYHITAGLYILHNFVSKFAGNFFELHKNQGQFFKKWLIFIIFSPFLAVQGISRELFLNHKGTFLKNVNEGFYLAGTFTAKCEECTPQYYRTVRGLAMVKRKKELRE